MPDLLDLLQEIEEGPLPCTHPVGVKNGGFAMENDPTSDYYREWVHADPACRRSAHPGKFKYPPPTMGWSREQQKDVPL